MTTSHDEFQRVTGFSNKQIEQFSIVEKGDFIGGGLEGGKGIRDPRGLVIGEGVIGRGRGAVPVWKIEGARGKLTAIPKEDARVLSKSEQFFKSLEKKLPIVRPSRRRTRTGK